MAPLRRYAVLQAGARMHYAVPALLARRGALAAFYTDLHGSHRPLELLDRLWPSGRQPPALRRLLGRRLPPDLPRELVRDQPVASLTWARSSQHSDALLVQRACRNRFGGANALYTNFINNDLDAVRQARELGLHVVHELIIGADVGRVLLEERRRFPGIEPEGESAEEVEAGIERDRQKWSLSDQVLVPSTYCWDSSVMLGCDPAKLALVPYGIPEHWFKLTPTPQPGRILFVGQVGLRKGSHVLAEACRILRGRGVPFECRVVGPQQVDVSDPLFDGPMYLGTVARSGVAEEFRQADLFVLPTLADSFGLVHLEAMACGVPVITTPHCGSVVRDGIDGCLVPIRDAMALADRMQQLLEDNRLRQRLGAAARERAWDYRWSRYGERLAEALLQPGRMAGSTP
ncbi:glycosyltransferase family 4 protein [Synechococcus sp. Cruz-9H2]|uniref:glycosyltransferase family 4 protein n=1 Tax=unclassified Synechococcus TaxID=2626047 RepID=UPI0020CD4FF5|nr:MULTISPECIES: glycosyltransferase family 4 protein [unclassified Synechococcus]MCP9820643.1 glycosyltransferase family 4 protein [Synechococcus sp. Cruz-9H2]MCP9844847.1 glycosyltransferase family 4 protein [Synechococcus sp. Edmonson 11F2]MCP9856969.1 glycosyltransferase family 4 protein [Synechococcus sp. Cruz-9C9]MCP9871524.1 glycosyltransferase family 4 protein [Synechococcus sp. Cruz-7B9]